MGAISDVGFILAGVGGAVGAILLVDPAPIGAHDGVRVRPTVGLGTLGATGRSSRRSPRPSRERARRFAAPALSIGAIGARGAMTEAIVFRHVRAVDPAGALDAEVDVVVERGRRHARRPRRGGRPRLERARARRRPARHAGCCRGSSTCTRTCASPAPRARKTWASGLRAAAAGGFVDVCCMPNTRPVNDSRVVTEMLVAKARAVGDVRLHPIGAITVGQRGEQLTEMADLKDAGAVAVSDDGRCVTNSQVMRRALEYAATFDLPSSSTPRTTR